MSARPSPPAVAVVGAGPAGLMAAQVLSAAGARVTVFERMPTAGRKLLMAGRGGLNLTHSEPFERFVTRYGAAAGWLEPYLDDFTPADLVAWAQDLGQLTFVGSSGRVFPTALKASPLLRAWLARLDEQGVVFRTRRRWTGWDETGALRFEGPDGCETVRADGAVLGLGGASWPNLGSDGAWASVLAAADVAVTPFKPANGGFAVEWSEPFRNRFAGQPLKAIGLSFDGERVRGEVMITAYGIEGGAIYALGAHLREAVERAGEARVLVDLRPDLSVEQIAARLARTPKGASVATTLRKALSLAPAASNLLREAFGPGLPSGPEALAQAVKAAPIRLVAAAPLARAISTAGGVRRESVDEGLMLKSRPNVFVAGEMLDWEAPTGGYLLQATLATGRAAAKALLARL